ncbi:MAG: hypothetical protein U0K65_05135, partial [Negativibacillus sp.]|nr:hypothetical protein [Negativibacillus sp.]
MNNKAFEPRMQKAAKLLQSWCLCIWRRCRGRSKEIHYINGPETLPPPLSRKEEEVFFLRLEEKDE